MAQEKIIIKFEAKDSEKLRVAMKQGHNGSRLLHNSFATLRSQMLLITFAMGLGGRQIIRFVKDAAKVEAMSMAFDSLSGAVWIEQCFGNKKKATEH